jgi:hypothetical protein
MNTPAYVLDARLRARDARAALLRHPHSAVASEQARIVATLAQAMRCEPEGARLFRILRVLDRWIRAAECARLRAHDSRGPWAHSRLRHLLHSAVAAEGGAS